MDMSQENIKNLFFKQIKELTIPKSDSFDLQFSDHYQEFEKEEIRRCLV